MSVHSCLMSGHTGMFWHTGIISGHDGIMSEQADIISVDACIISAMVVICLEFNLHIMSGHTSTKSS